MSVAPNVHELSDSEIEENRKRSKFEQFSFKQSDMWGACSFLDTSYHKPLTDDRKNPLTSDTCNAYIEHMDEMIKKNMGILLYGPIGSGKSFLARMIAHGAYEQMIYSALTTVPTLIGALQGARDKHSILSQLNLFDILVLDDLGAERDSQFAAEMVYSIIDARYRAQKPIILTTNVPLDELKNPPTMTAGRIYDRIMEMCPIRLLVDGESRRTKIAENKAKYFASIVRDRSMRSSCAEP